MSYKAGKLSKANFAAALRAHQAAVDATKSPQRDEAEEIKRNPIPEPEFPTEPAWVNYATAPAPAPAPAATAPAAKMSSKKP